MLSFAASPALALLDLWWGNPPAETGGTGASQVEPTASAAASTMPGGFSWALSQATQIKQPAGAPASEASSASVPCDDVDEELPAAGALSLSWWRTESAGSANLEAAALPDLRGGLASPHDPAGQTPNGTDALVLADPDPLHRQAGVSLPGSSDLELERSVAVGDPVPASPAATQATVPTSLADPLATKTPAAALPATGAAAQEAFAADAADALAKTVEGVSAAIAHTPSESAANGPTPGEIAADTLPESSSSSSLDSSPEEPSTTTRAIAPTISVDEPAGTATPAADPSAAVTEVPSAQAADVETDVAMLAAAAVRQANEPIGPTDGKAADSSATHPAASETARTAAMPRASLGPVAFDSEAAHPADPSSEAATDSVKRDGEGPRPEFQDRMVVRMDSVTNTDAPPAPVRLDPSLADIAHRVAAMSRPESAAGVQSSQAEATQTTSGSQSAQQGSAQTEIVDGATSQRASHSGQDAHEEPKQDLPHTPASNAVWKSSGAVTDPSAVAKAQPAPDLHSDAMRSVASTLVRMAEDDLLASAAPRRVTVELSPSHLGKVQIEIVQDPNRSLTVHLTASAEHTRMALDADADDLVQHLRHHSLDVNKVEVKGESDPQDGRGRDSLRQRSDDGLSREGRQSSEDRRDRGASRRPHDFTDYRYWEAIR